MLTNSDLNRRAAAQATLWRSGLFTPCVVLALHLVFTSGLSGQVVRGTILDSESQQPVRDVAVLVDGATTFQTTASTGSFQLSGLDRGTHVLVFMKNEYSPRTFSFSVTDSHDGEIDVGILLLSPGPPPAANITGTVSDSLTGLPVLSAQVHVNGEYVAVTDMFGGVLDSIDRASMGFQHPRVSTHWLFATTSGTLDSAG